MRYILFTLTLLMSAAVASAAPPTGRPLPVDPQQILVDRLFPETQIEGDGWRGLLPIFRMNHERDLRQPLVRSKDRETATR